MKPLIVILALLTLPLAAQTAAEPAPAPLEQAPSFVFLAAGHGGQPIGYAGAGWRIRERIYFWSAASFVADKPTTVEPGILYHVAAFGPLTFFAVATGGIAMGASADPDADQQQVGAMLSGGILAHYSLRQWLKQPIGVMGGFRQLKTSISPSQREWVIGLELHR